MSNYFELIKIFCTVANTENFKKAAVKLGKSPQSITRAIQELEDQKGEILFYRSTRGHKITRAGEELLIQAQPLLKQINELVKNSTHESNQNISGHIRLTMPTAFGRHLVIPLITKFQTEYPNIKVSCILTDEHSDVIENQIDIGLRVGFLNDNRFVSRKVMNIGFRVVGSPELIKRVGQPYQIDDLDSFPIIAFENLSLNQYWFWGFEYDQTFLPSSPFFSTNDLDAYCQAIVDGIGFAHIPEFLALPMIQQGTAIEVMKNVKSSPWGLYLYRPQLGPTPKRIKLLYNYLAENFIKSN